MDSFYDLQKSDQFEDQLIYEFLIKLLDWLFGKHDQIIIDIECESEKNQQLIRDQFSLIEWYFKVPKRVKSTQKNVRQTLKHIIDYLNNRYEFKNPIKMYSEKKSYREGSRVSSIGYTVLKLV